ncbi:MAG: nucleoside 2-deoxyribosyltransferase [Oscillospiraceae bacterium]|jgi:hypothetical protein|nr:nucleoside 2-deoxyribosyltransferase [Oscillospiraceae bacterium]
MKKNMKKIAIQANEHKKINKIIYLPLSIIIPTIITLSVLIMALVFITPVTFDALLAWMYYNSLSDPYIFLIIFLLILTLIVFLTTWILRLNEKIKNRLKEDDSNINISVHSNFDSDRSYLEQKIAELSDQLLSSQKRWEEVNHLVLSSHNKNITNNGDVSPSNFLAQYNINVVNIEIDKSLIFVLTPFHSDSLTDYKTIMETCNDLKFKVLRGDEEPVLGDIFAHTLKCITKARIVIANLNGRNPNVFYELGIAHSLNKPTILISHVENQVPFDLQSRFVVIYDNQEDLAFKLKNILIQLLQS